ncbi:MAG: hypothetical protein U9O90_07135, partial [Euryarchaeota archaeon]|nr:hypothetical protein [Euryarchaeota archaeon]
MITCGKRKYNDFYLYLFEDQDLRLEEQKTLYRKLEERKIDKKREVAEKMFDTYKTVLNADKLYLQNDESVFGHVFIAFLSLYILCKLEQHLKNAKHNHKFSPIDLLYKYSKVYYLEIRGRGMIT